jgi:diguanylate cyclase (GGDEF)-like protein/PAS domain S-box-containing protein
MATDKDRRRPLLVPRARAAVARVPANPEWQRPEAVRFAPRDWAEVTLDSIGDAVLSTDLAGRVTYLNAAAEAMTGWSRTAAAGRPIDDVLHIVSRGTRKPARDPLSLAIELDKTVGLLANSILVRPDGQETEIEDSAAPIRGRDGTVTGAVMVFRDVGAALETSRQMSHLAQRDALTGLPNRLLLGDRLTAAIALAHRHSKPLAVLFLDLDGFKSLNDSLGHAAGDQLLRSVASRLDGSVRQSDTVSRYGGDEFVIILSEMEHPGNAAAVGRKLLEAVAQPHRVGTRDASLTGSLGISLYPDHGQDPDTLVAIADAAMYAAKRAGPGNVRLAAGR